MVLDVGRQPLGVHRRVFQGIRFPFGPGHCRCLWHLLLTRRPVLDPRCQRCLFGNYQRRGAVTHATSVCGALPTLDYRLRVLDRLQFKLERVPEYILRCGPSPNSGVSKWGEFSSSLPKTILISFGGSVKRVTP